MKLELFYFESCPFCQIVLQLVKELNIKLDYLDIQRDSSAMSRLQNDTGRKTVPCLYIDNKPMFESRDIMLFFKENHNSLEKA